jgi:ribA/ribD-fused uncharacterized protein
MTEYRVYDTHAVVQFCRPRDAFGILANFAHCRLVFKGICTPTSEHLYQALKFRTEAQQRRILATPSAFDAKQLAHTLEMGYPQPLWNQHLRVPAMRFVLRAKTLQHWQTISDALQATCNKPIVERSSSDAYWGATLDGAGSLRGQNVLGRLWMEVRAQIRSGQLTASSPNPPHSNLFFPLL